MVANITKVYFGIFTSLFLACSNSGDFKFHLDSKNSTFGINFSVVVDEEDAEPPVVWPALYLPDRNVVIPAVLGEAIVSMFKHEKHGTRMWHSGERRFVEVAEWNGNSELGGEAQPGQVCEKCCGGEAGSYLQH
ncbi:hypothetical protein BDR26DRAFT_859118 [Obelidium mucronatum]|nr:hypothetical protein BDR26DRAFT_859118 [Obelidium mucronatum]